MEVTVVVSAILIDVQSTGGVEETFDTVVTAINAHTAGTVTGSGTSGNPYIITGDRELQIRNGCKVRFVEDTHVTWNAITTSDRYAIDWQSGSQIEIEAGCVFSMSGSAAQIYNSFAGLINITGTALKYVTITGMSRNYFYTYTGDCIWEYFKITENKQAAEYYFYFQQVNAQAGYKWIFRNFEVTSTTNKGYVFYFSPGGMYANIEIYDFVIDNCYCAFYINGCSAKLKNGIIKNCSYYAGLIYGGGNVVSAGYETSVDDTLFPTGRFQSMIVFENIHFIDNATDISTKNQMLIYYNSLVLLTNCTFEGDTLSTLRSYYTAAGSYVLERNNTFINMGMDRNWTGAATTLHCHEVAITVKDSSNNPIKEAMVSFIQASDPSKERWAGLTDADGHLLTVFGDNMVLVEKEQSATSTFHSWSDNLAGGLYHKYTVSKHGYETLQGEIEITEDKSLEFTLLPLGSTSSESPYKPIIIDQEVIK